MQGKRGRPSMEDELLRALNRHLEVTERAEELEAKHEEAYDLWGRLGREAKAERQKALALLKEVRAWRNGVEVKRRTQTSKQEVAALPANVIPIELRG